MNEHVGLVTVEDAAEYLELSRSKVYELLADGELPSVRIGRSRRVSVSDLEEFVARHREPVNGVGAATYDALGST